MFAKLKKRISEEEGGVPVRGLPPGSTVAGRLPRSLSRESLTSTGADSGDDTSLDGSASREELLGLLSRRTDQIRKLEAKLGECAEQLRNTARLKEKLEAALERQQDSSMRKMQELNESYQAKRSKMAENATLALEKNNKEWTEKLAAIEKERKELALRLAEFEERSVDFFQRRDERDELTELQQQETAKIKHMLLRKEEEGRNLSEEVAQARGDIAALEAQLDAARDDLATLRANGAALKSDNSYLRRELDEERRRGEEKERERSLQNQRLSLELEQAGSALQELQDERGALKAEAASLRQHSEQAVREAEERCAVIGRLTEKALSLERRIAGDVTTDQHTQELLRERTQLEDRLEELSARLSETQSVATATTSGLEQQVQELRERVRELEAAAQAVEEERTGRTRSHDDELRRLRQDLAATRDELTRTQRVATAREGERDQARAEGEAERQRLQQQWMACRQQLSALETARQYDRTASLHSMAQLQAERDELTERVSETEVAAHGLDDDLHGAQAELTVQRAALARATSDLEVTRRRGDALQTQLCELQEVLSLTERRLAEAQERCADAETRHYALQQELRASQALAEERQRALREEAEEEEELATMVSTTTTTVPRDDRNGKEEGGEEEERASAQLRVELAEKNKTIKQLQQRLAELKKTLQRELRLRVEGSDSTTSAVTDGRDRSFGVPQPPPGPLDAPDWLRGGAVFGGALGGPGAGGGPAGLAPYLAGVGEPRVNLQYLKHVVLKFVSAREAEAFHLVRAISVLLHLSSEEERLLKETLEYKMSWFGTRPAPQGAVRPSITGSGLPW